MRSAEIGGAAAAAAAITSGARIITHHRENAGIQARPAGHAKQVFVIEKQELALSRSSRIAIEDLAKLGAIDRETGP
jgi:hypothetical protein